MQFEFRSAHLEALRNNYAQRLIIIILGQPNLVAANLDPDMLEWLKSCTCLHWGERIFWQRLRFAMPDLSYNRQVANAPHLRYQTLAPHQKHGGAHGQPKSGNQTAKSKGHHLGANFLKSASGLLGGHSNNTSIPPPMGQQQLVTSSMHQSLGRPLPHQPLGNFPNQKQSQHQLQLQEEHHYAHLTPATMIQQQQQQAMAGGEIGHAYHQPIYGDPSQQQQQQQRQQRDSNPVHI